MNRIYTPTLLLIATLLTGCDDIGRAVNPTEVVEANGETYVIDQSTGNVSVVEGLQLKPLELPSTEVFTLEIDTTLSSTAIDFEFLISGTQVYWSGRITPNIDAEVFESEEEREAFLELWRRNIRKENNRITFKIERVGSSITFGEIFVSMSEMRTRAENDDGDLEYYTGDGRRGVEFDYRLIEYQGGTVGLFPNPQWVLDIED
jgi:hypothetical protein